MRELTLDALVENLDRVLAFVDGELEAMECPMRAQLQIEVAVEELFVNIAHYAYETTGSATIRVETQEQPRGVDITFIDSGTPYDPLAREDPDVTLSAEERQIGGLGIFMVKQSMDDGKNVLRIRKLF